jgi:TIR domain
MQVFISFGSEDRYFAETLHYSLLNAGHKTFYDRRSLQPGDEFDLRICEEIKRSDLFVFLISPSSISKGSYALTELDHAERKWSHPVGT